MNNLTSIVCHGGKKQERNRIGLCWMFAVTLLVLGCGDERIPPATSPDPAYTETILLWQDALSGGNQVAAQFEVKQPLAPITRIGIDHPSRLTIVAYIEPDSTILRYEEIVFDSLPLVNLRVITYSAIMEQLRDRLDSLHSVDTAFTNRGCPSLGPCAACPCTMYTQIAWCAIDTCGSAGLRAAIIVDSARYYDTLTVWKSYQVGLGLDRDSLAVVADDRFRLALWFEEPSDPPVYPEAVYTSEGQLENQSIYLAETDTLTGLKGRRFALNMDLIRVADPLPANFGNTEEVHWSSCLPGVTKCLSPGFHTLYARLEGAVSTRITGTLVLVYSGERP